MRHAFAFLVLLAGCDAGPVEMLDVGDGATEPFYDAGALSPGDAGVVVGEDAGEPSLDAGRDGDDAGHVAEGDAGALDGGAALHDAGSASRCGNGRLDPGELCDPADEMGRLLYASCINNCSEHRCMAGALLDPVTNRCFFRRDDATEHQPACPFGYFRSTVWWRDRAERDRQIELYRRLIPEGSTQISGFMRIRWSGGATWRWDTPTRPVATDLMWRSGEPQTGFDCATLVVPRTGAAYMVSRRCTTAQAHMCFADPPNNVIE